jgi:hypothetical protein
MAGIYVLLLLFICLQQNNTWQLFNDADFIVWLRQMSLDVYRTYVVNLERLGRMQSCPLPRIYLDIIWNDRKEKDIHPKLKSKS